MDARTKERATEFIKALRCPDLDYWTSECKKEQKRRKEVLAEIRDKAVHVDVQEMRN